MQSQPTSESARAIGIETRGMGKRFGLLIALDDVSIKVEAGSFHALLGENGAGKSTLVKCMMGFYQPSSGSLLVNGVEQKIDNPRQAHALGIGMVYQHFTLVPSLTAAENLVISRADTPFAINWKQERQGLERFLSTTPFKVPLDVPVSGLAAGEKQKLEILKQLYLDQHFLILDEPTSVLTPDEADEILGLLRGMTQAGDLTILMISHKFREVTSYADELTVLRRGCQVGSGLVKETPVEAMSRMMIGDTQIVEAVARKPTSEEKLRMELVAVYADDDEQLPALEGVNLKVHSGEIVGIAGVSGNGQSELIEVLSGQRQMSDGRIFIDKKPYEPQRKQMAQFKIFGFSEEPLKNVAVPRMSVAENMAFRSFDKPPISPFKGWLNTGPMRRKAQELIDAYRVKTPSTEEPIENLSGGNVQRAILAREISGDVEILIVANPCFGLDFASVADIRAQIMEQRNRGAAVLLVSEDLDEILELSDTVAVMSEGRITFQAPLEQTSRAEIGHAMAGQH